MNANNGQERKCQWCEREGNTAHDLAWNENINGWLCDKCRRFAGIGETESLELSLDVD